MSTKKKIVEAMSAPPTRQIPTVATLTALDASARNNATALRTEAESLTTLATQLRHRGDLIDGHAARLRSLADSLDGGA